MDFLKRTCFCLDRHILLLFAVALPVATLAQEETHRSRWHRFLFNRMPAISAYYGFTENTLNGLTQSLANPRSLELRLGGIRIEEESDGIIQMKHNYFTLANVSNEIGNKSSGNEINTNMWRFGFAWEKGYGYGSKDSPAPAIILNHSNGIHWSKLTVKGNVPIAADKELLSSYDAFRFGTKMEAGVTFRVAPLVAVTAGYERSVIFRRHLVTQWLGSVALEGAANWVLDGFIDKIMDASPEAVPVVNFLLKNGLSYGVYQLRKEKMNYPFDSEAPIVNDTFKVGVTFIF